MSLEERRRRSPSKRRTVEEKLGEDEQEGETKDPVWQEHALAVCEARDEESGRGRGGV